MQDSIIDFMNKEEKYSFQIGWLNAVSYMQFLMEEEFGNFIVPRITSEEAYKKWKEEEEEKINGARSQGNIRARV